MEHQLPVMPHDHGNQNLLNYLPGKDICAITADVFKQLSDGSRLQIFWLLCHSEECVINIATAVNMSAPAVSHHLRFMKQAGLIVSRRDGKEVYYTLAATSEAILVHQMVDQLLQTKCPEGREYVHTQ